MIAEGKARAADNTYRASMTVAWNAVAAHRSKRMPPLKQMLGKRPARTAKPAAMSPDQMMTMARMWSAVAGPKKKEGL